MRIRGTSVEAVPPVRFVPLLEGDGGLRREFSSGGLAIRTSRAGPSLQ